MPRAFVGVVRIRLGVKVGFVLGLLLAARKEIEGGYDACLFVVTRGTGFECKVSSSLVAMIAVDL